jgi:endo-beta-N-acetylglucosaminidase D
VVRIRPDIRFIPFAVAEFSTLGGHATAFLTELAKQATASTKMYVGKLLASSRRKFSLTVRVAHADNVLRGFSAAADGVEAASSLVGIPSPATAVFR